MQGWIRFEFSFENGVRIRIEMVVVFFDAHGRLREICIMD